jgi:hypothetical protein
LLSVSSRSCRFSDSTYASLPCRPERDQLHRGDAERDVARSGRTPAGRGEVPDVGEHLRLQRRRQAVVQPDHARQPAHGLPLEQRVEHDRLLPLDPQPQRLDQDGVGRLVGRAHEDVEEALDHHCLVIGRRPRPHEPPPLLRAPPGFGYTAAASRNTEFARC